MAAAPPSVGDVFVGRFRIDALLGEGGFGWVFRAIDVGTQRNVALKVLKPDAPDGYQAITRRRVQREAAAVSSVRGEHVVTLYEYGESPEGWLFLVFEWAPGEDLADELNRVGTMRPGMVEHVLRQVLRALAEVHAVGVLHRDLKPENIRVSHDRAGQLRVRLLDFGLARSHADPGQSRLTATGELVGTPRYMSPEQLRDEALTPASDIYSLGLVAFELLVGREALGGSSLMAQLERLFDGHEVVDKDADRHGRGLMRIIRRMTAVEPRDRFATANAVLAALDSLDRDATVQRRSVERTRERPVRQSWRVVAVVVAVVAVGLVYALVRSPAPARRSVPQPTKLARVAEPAESPPAVRTTKPDSSEAPMVPEGCGRTVQYGRQELHWTDGLTPYSIAAYIPASYAPDVPAPVFVLFHKGGGQDADGILDETNFFKLADEHGIVLVAPQSSASTVITSDGVRAAHLPWRAGPRQQALTILHALEAGICMDRRRLVTVGLGHGAEAAREAGCELQAALVVEASDRFEHSDDPRCLRRVPTLLLSPTLAPCIPTEGAVEPSRCVERAVPSARQHLATFTKPHQCEPQSRVALAAVPGGACSSWDCQTPLWHCDVEAGIHWPHYNATRVTDCEGPTQTAFPYQRVVWDVFERAATEQAR